MIVDYQQNDDAVQEAELLRVGTRFTLIVGDHTYHHIHLTPSQWKLVSDSAAAAAQMLPAYGG